MIEKNLSLLEQNLIKKKNVLNQFQELCDKQFLFIDSQSMTTETFRPYMDGQDSLVEELIVLNEEADLLYESLEKEWPEDKTAYLGQIETLQKLMQELSATSDSLQEKEKACREKLEVYFEKERKELGAGRKSSNAALNYYKSMSKLNVIPPQFMDQKK